MTDRARTLATLTLLSSLVAACGGAGGGSSAPTPVPTPAPIPTPSPAPTPVPAPAPTPTVAQRSAAAASAASSAADCVAVQPFYWSVGDATGKLGDGSVGTVPPVASTVMAIASASKLVYGAYVAEERGGALTDADAHYLNFVSGYTDFDACLQDQTVATCEAYESNGT